MLLCFLFFVTLWIYFIIFDFVGLNIEVNLIFILCRTTAALCKVYEIIDGMRMFSLSETIKRESLSDMREEM